ncbi:MAG: response regulator [Actinomycetota bacterium]
MSPDHGEAPAADLRSGLLLVPDVSEESSASPPRVRILIAEDHTVVAQALETMLSFDSNFEVIAIAQSGEEAVRLCLEHQPNVVLMDVVLRGLSGIEATRQIAQASPSARVLILSMYDDQQTVMRAVAAGAVGFVPKNVDREELQRAIRAIAEGKGFLHPDLTGPFLDRVGLIAKEALGRERLTEREQVVLGELAQGKSNREIARALVLSEETVKTHLTHIYQKLGVNDRVQAVALALRRGLID